MNLIGVRAHDYGKQPIDSLCRAIAADGWRCVQLAFPKAVEGVGSFSDVSSELVEQTGTALSENGLSLAVLGVYIEPSLADETARKAQAEIFTASLMQAKVLRAGCVGTETASMKKQPGVTRAEALVKLRYSLEEILPEAERLGVDIALEPVHYHALNTPEETRRLLNDMRSERLKIIFDPVNLLEDGAEQTELWKRCADAFRSDIRAIHIKGMPQGSTLEASCIDYTALFGFFRGCNAPVLRELAIPEQAASDIALIRTALTI